MGDTTKIPFMPEPQRAIDNHLDDAFLYGQQASRIHRPGVVEHIPIKTMIPPIEPGMLEELMKRFNTPGPLTIKKPDPSDFTNAELIHEMLERGFAVMKLPAAGGPPEVLKDD